MKKCTKCNEVRSLEDFTRDSRSKDGRHSNCKICTRLRDAKRLNEKKEEINARRRQSNKDRGEEILIKQRIYRENNKDRINALQNKLHKEKMENDPVYRETRRQKEREYYINNKEVCDLNSKKSALKHRERRTITSQKWKQANKDLRASYSAKRRAKKLNATPLWLTDEQIDEINSIYKEAKRLQEETGNIYHVDHIVPLINDKVCGLHVPWNLQILTAKENASKGNKLL